MVWMILIILISLMMFDMLVSAFQLKISWTQAFHPSLVAHLCGHCLCLRATTGQSTSYAVYISDVFWTNAKNINNIKISIYLYIYICIHLSSKE